jgi:hypothetical protein
LGVGPKAEDLALQKNIIVAKSEGVKAGWSNFQEHTSLVESVKNGCGSKPGVLLMMMRMMMGWLIN